LLERKLTQAADTIEAQDKRFAAHLDAWKANNAWHAARIAELEGAIRGMMSNLEDQGHARPDYEYCELCAAYHIGERVLEPPAAQTDSPNADNA
jgi:hypothetical protein